MNYINKFSMKGKNVIVLGGMGLIGKEISIAIATTGANLLILDINEKTGLPFVNRLVSDGCKVSFKKIDLSELDVLESNFVKILSSFKKLDVFINCSYPKLSNPVEKSFAKMKFQAFRNLVDIQMNSFCWLAKIAAEKMTMNVGGGSIVQIGSIYGVVGQNLSVYKDTDMTENIVYSAIKGGITNFTRQMASYYGKYNIRVNTVSPGGLSDNQNKVFVENYTMQTPLKRMGKAEEVASTVLFLSSDAASYISGENIMVDGGWTAI